MKKTVLLCIILLTACSSPQPDVVAVPQFLATATAHIDGSYPTAQVAIAAPNQNAGGIDVTMSRAWVDGKSLNAEVCYTLPDTSDWSIWSASLNYAGNVSREYGSTLVSVQEPADGLPGKRCDTLTFVVPPDADLSNSTIEIQSIGALPREGDYCSLFMPKIQQTLLERGIGIALECVDVNGSQTMQIVSFPPDMTQEQAEQIVFSDEFYTVKGPWSFSFSLTQ